ncbi:hypothetical protein Gotur_019015, partial [Gossypium turneri]
MVDKNGFNDLSLRMLVIPPPWSLLILVNLVSGLKLFQIFFCQLVLPPHMDERLRTAARTGNVTDLYNLIQRDGNVLRHFDEVEFVDTPLHIAAEEGCIRFAME